MKRRALLVVLLSIGLGACGIPDLKPFSDATAEMATVLKQGFERARASLGAATETASDDNQAEFNNQLRKLDERWNETRKALSSLVAYSDSLAAVAEAGRSGKETMAKVTGALSDLAASVGAFSIPSAGTKIIEAVGAKIIEMQAEKDIRNAVDTAAAAVDIMAPVLKDNFADLRKIHRAAATTWESRVGATSSSLRSYHEVLEREQRRLEHLLTLISEYQAAPANLRARAAKARADDRPDLAKKFLDSIPQEQADYLTTLKEFDSAFDNVPTGGNDVLAKVEIRQQRLLELINVQRKELAQLEPAYAHAIAELDAVREARVTGDRLLEKAGEAIDAWQKAHHTLQAAARGQQSRPSVADLISVISELQALLK
jgi:hypothetical protein